MSDSRAIEIELLEEERQRLEATPIGARLASVYRALETKRADGFYKRLGLTAAARVLLEETGRPMTTREIKIALTARGLTTRSRKLGATIYATLTNSAAFERLGEGRLGTWALKAWRIEREAA